LLHYSSFKQEIPEKDFEYMVFTYWFSHYWRNLSGEQCSSIG
jgi:hypothetical protein